MMEGINNWQDKAVENSGVKVPDWELVPTNSDNEEAQEVELLKRLEQHIEKNRLPSEEQEVAVKETSTQNFEQTPAGQLGAAEKHSEELTENLQYKDLNREAGVMSPEQTAEKLSVVEKRISEPATDTRESQKQSRKEEDRVRIDAIREEIKGIFKKESVGESEMPVQELKAVEDDLSRLVFELRAREGERLNPLIESSSISRLAAGINELGSVVRQKSLNTIDLEKIFFGVSSVLSSFGEVHQGGVLRENEESLIRIMHVARDSTDRLKSLHRKIPEDHKNEDLRKAIRRLGGMLERAYDFTGRKRSALERY